jgi:hypothetical protein
VEEDDDPYLWGWNHIMPWMHEWSGPPNEPHNRDRFIEIRLVTARQDADRGIVQAAGIRDALLHYRRHGDYRARPPRGRISGGG